MESYLLIMDLEYLNNGTSRKMLAENITVQTAFDLAKEAKVLNKQPKGQSCMHFPNESDLCASSWQKH